MTSSTVKKYLRDTFGLRVRVSTTPTKHPWITAWISPDKGTGDRLIYSSAPFPEAFRQRCLRVVYPNDPVLHNQTSAGNVTAYSIALTSREWTKIIEGATIYTDLSRLRFGVRCAGIDSEWMTEAQAIAHAKKLTGEI